MFHKHFFCIPFQLTLNKSVFFPSISPEQNINIAFQLLAGPKWGPDTDWASDGKKAERRDWDHSCSIWGAKQKKKNTQKKTQSSRRNSIVNHIYYAWIDIVTAYSMNLSIEQKLHAEDTSISAVLTGRE